LGTSPVAPLEKVSFTFPDTRGEPYDFRARTDGRITLLYFGYTYCPDICPVQMAALAAALREVAPEVRSAVTTVFVTVDPARDTPERLEGWLSSFDSTFVGLRPGDQELAQALAFYRYPPPQSSGEPESYTMSHPAVVYAFTPDNLGRALYGPETSKAVWAHDLTALAGRDWTAGGGLPPAPTGDLMAQVGGIQVLDAVVPRPPTATTAAFYVTVRNAGTEADTLLGISTPAAERAMLHEMVMEGGVMRMVPLMGGIPLPPGATLRLEPGARHGMLEGLGSLPEPGGTVIVVLRFARAGEVPVPARLVSYEDVGTGRD
jgi:protein SCO1/2